MSSTEAAKGREAGEVWQLEFGARPLAGGGTRFRVWSPVAESLSVRIVGEEPRTFEMERREGDVFELTLPEVGAGMDYFYVVGGERERPDPVSRWQPRGVHGPSRVVDPDAFAWTDDGWRGVPLKDAIIYELHVGTFTPEGTFESAIEKLPHLKRLGVNAVEVMPVAEFPGGRNWGYDGTHSYAPQSTYGGPEGFRKFVDACHGEGLAVVLDVVYNHLGPEGNYLGEFAPIFGQNYRTPWGDALNFDGPDSDGVRRYFVENALYWLTEYHVDGLRLDAIHRIIDIGPRHLLAEIADRFRRQAAALGRVAWTIGESDLNDVRVIKPEAEGGYGLDAQWSDDFHHSLHAALTGTRRGYFADFGRVADLAKAIEEGFVYDGRASVFRRKLHGNSSVGRPGEQFVVCVQNHDQIANGYWGDRLAAIASVEQQKAAAALMLCAPNVPMLFMGQEWGEVAPFLYFTSHTDAALAKAVREGRREEYSSFVKEEGETVSDAADFDDPQSAQTFERSKLVWTRLGEQPHAGVLEFYRDLIAARREHPALSNCDKTRTRVEFDEERRRLAVGRGDEGVGRTLLLCNLSDDAQDVPADVSGGGAWRLALWSGEEKYAGGADSAAPPPSLDEEAAKKGVRLSGWGAALYVSA
ncbi:MAG TPA: malto-oligosyltrehalose trehalohydrolase [Pyrinomonadaceae bacterium]|nr:malto-oligosyltrehalose trehalohydrolase [Pyrinomonadaceae bacterium]